MDKPALDRGLLLGVLLAVCGVAAGLLLDGGSLRQILQPTAALIVLGGTLGAVLIQFPSATVLAACRELRQALHHPGAAAEDTADELLRHCTEARRFGMLRLDARLDSITDPLLRKGLTGAVDGVPADELRELLHIDLCLREDEEAGMVEVLEAAGGFSPTLGIVGAVLGLIQVMQHMDNVAAIGRGIAAAFVSTLYGIALANLCFLPLAGKLRIRFRQRQLLRGMTVEAVTLIAGGITARGLRQRLEAYSLGLPHAQPVAAAAPATAAAQPELVTR